MKSRRQFLKYAIQLIGSLLWVSKAKTISLIERNNFRYRIHSGRVLQFGQLKEIDCYIQTDGTLILENQSFPAQEEINASGFIVSPGFIDVLSDNSFHPETTYFTVEKYKISDGVTTALQCHGGHHSADYYYSHFGSKKHLVNFGVASKVMSIRLQTKDISKRLERIETNLIDGALAVAHSIEYQETPYEECLLYAKLAYKYDRPFFIHLRYSSKEKELLAVEEAIRLAFESKAHIHISHLHSTGGTFWMEKALDTISKAIRSGARITCCVYPYSYWATYLSSRRFNEGWLKQFQLDYQDLTVVGTGEKLTEKRFKELRKQTGILVAVPEGTMPFDKTVNRALQMDFCLIASDGGIESPQKANNHPRGAGNFSTAFRHMQGLGFSPEKSIEKMTLLPRNLLSSALKNRGELTNGYQADIVLFNPTRLNGKASVENPNKFSEGIESVFVNGHLSYCKNQFLAYQGLAIKN